MTSIGRLLNWKRALEIGSFLLIFSVFIYGCGPSHFYWVERMNGFVNKDFNSGLDSCVTNCGSSYWAPVNNDRSFYKIDSEGEGKRYYIKWNSHCFYSIYVSSDGLIKSWRYESESKASCYVY